MTLPTDHLPLADILIRLGVSSVAGAIVGFERESHGRAAGLRTTLLACLGACIAAILSEYFFLEAAASVPNGSTWRPDPARMAQGILSGMGFLGAGAIIKEGNVVRGVTTAAVLWFVTILGLTFGSGHLVLGGIGFGLGMLALILLPYVERYVQADWYRTVTVVFAGGGPDEDAVRQAILASGAVIKEVEFDEDLAAATHTLRFKIRIKRHQLSAVAAALRTSLRRMPAVTRIRWE